MGLLETLAGVFINTFGITQPTPENRRRAAWFIAGMMLLVLAGVIAGSFLLLKLLRS